jgi:hypothetical protein
LTSYAQWLPALTTIRYVKDFAKPATAREVTQTELQEAVVREFDDLVAGAGAVDVSGWDFGWLEGRATEQRPSWGYQRLISERLETVSSALDIQTGGGEVLGGARGQIRRDGSYVAHSTRVLIEAEPR